MAGWRKALIAVAIVCVILALISTELAIALSPHTRGQVIAGGNAIMWWLGAVFIGMGASFPA